MRLRAFQALVIALSFAAVFPPPRVMNALIAAGPRQNPTESKKPLQARGRNRIGTVIHTEVGQSVAPLSNGARPPRVFSWLCRYRSQPRLSRLVPSRFSGPIFGFLRLRC